MKIFLVCFGCFDWWSASKILHITHYPNCKYRFLSCLCWDLALMSTAPKFTRSFRFEMFTSTTRCWMDFKYCFSCSSNVFNVHIYVLILKVCYLVSSVVVFSVSSFLVYETSRLHFLISVSQSVSCFFVSDNIEP